MNFPRKEMGQEGTNLEDRGKKERCGCAIKEIWMHALATLYYSALANISPQLDGSILATQFSSSLCIPGSRVGHRYFSEYISLASAPQVFLTSRRLRR